MKLFGLIGGMGPESTIDYYRLIVAEYRARTTDGSYPPVLINSVDLHHVISLVGANELDQLATYLIAEVQRVAHGGASYAALAANTPHIVFDEVQRASSIPLISIVQATRDVATSLGLRSLALLGARFTMQSRFYADVFAPVDIALVTPTPEEQDLIHEKYFGELVNGVFLRETRDAILAITHRVKERENVQGVILAGTELPLLLRDHYTTDLQWLDTTQIHVKTIVDTMLL